MVNTKTNIFAHGCLFHVSCMLESWFSTLLSQNMQWVIMAIAMIKNSDWIVLSIFLTILSNGDQPTRIIIMHINCYWHSANNKVRRTSLLSINFLIYTAKYQNRKMKLLDLIENSKKCPENRTGEYCSELQVNWITDQGSKSVVMNYKQHGTRSKPIKW